MSDSDSDTGNSNDKTQFDSLCEARYDSLWEAHSELKDAHKSIKETCKTMQRQIDWLRTDHQELQKRFDKLESDFCDLQETKRVPVDLGVQEQSQLISHGIRLEDPAPFDGEARGVSPDLIGHKLAMDFNDWITRVQLVLINNGDHFPDEISKIGYVFSRLKGSAAALVIARILPGSGSFETVQELLDYLSVTYISNDFQRLKRKEFRELMQLKDETFRAFYARFINLLPYSLDHQDEKANLRNLRARLTTGLPEVMETRERRHGSFKTVGELVRWRTAAENRPRETRERILEQQACLTRF